MNLQALDVQICLQAFQVSYHLNSLVHDFPKRVLKLSKQFKVFVLGFRLDVSTLFDKKSGYQSFEKPRNFLQSLFLGHKVQHMTKRCGSKEGFGGARATNYNLRHSSSEARPLCFFYCSLAYKVEKLYNKTTIYHLVGSSTQASMAPLLRFFMHLLKSFE